MNSIAQKNTTDIVDHFFRHEHARVISLLVNSFGTENIEIIEDSVQEALIKAVQNWPFNTVPDNPTAWLIRVARNQLLDTLRRKQNFSTKENSIAQEIETVTSPNDSVLEAELEDGLLKIIFACCHPSISAESQIILSLKILCGFSNKEIGRALLKKEEAIAKAYTRARGKMKEHVKQLESPDKRELEERINTALKVIYLMFNEGYNSADANELIRKDLCVEAMRLTLLLIDKIDFEQSKSHALLALMCFQSSRFDSRISGSGRLLTLKEQDRGTWNKVLVEQGRFHLARSTEKGEISEYHLQASIAACHAFASNYEDTQWESILQLYDALIPFLNNRIVKLNRIVAIKEVHGSKKALVELELLENQNPSFINYLIHAIKAELLFDIDKTIEAKEELNRAIQLTSNELEKNYLVEKLNGA